MEVFVLVYVYNHNLRPQNFLNFVYHIYCWKYLTAVRSDSPHLNTLEHNQK